MTQEKEPCKPCRIAREFPEYRMFNPACLYCGARIIQLMARLPIPATQVAARRRENLAHWVAHGHSEAEIRALVKGPLAIGPARASAPENQPPPKRR